MNWISTYLLKNKSINLTNKLLNKISLCSKVKRSNYKLVGNFLINIEISKNLSDSKVYLNPTFENIERGLDLYKNLEKNKNKIQNQYLGYSGFSTTDFEISLLIDSYITGIEIWMATVSMNFNPENKKNVGEIWKLLNSSDDQKSNTIEYFQKILSMQSYYPKYVKSRVFLEESYRLNPLENNQLQASSEIRKNRKYFENSIAAFKYACENFDNEIEENEYVLSLVIDYKSTKARGIADGATVINADTKVIPILKEYDNDIQKISDYILKQSIYSNNNIKKHLAVINPNLNNIKLGDFVISMFTLETHLAIAHIEKKLKPELDLSDNSWIIDE